MNGTAVIYPKTRGTRTLHERITETKTTEHGITTTSKWVPIGTEEYFYEVSIDLKGLNALAVKAANNKGGKSKDGPLHVRILERKRISTIQPNVTTEGVIR